MVPRHTRSLSAASCLVLLALASCSTEGKNIHKSKLEPRAVAIKPPIMISVPKDLVDDAFGTTKILKGPKPGGPAHLSVNLWGASEMPTSKAGAKVNARVSGREINGVGTPDFVGVAWKSDTASEVEAIFWKKLPAGIVTCRGKVTYGALSVDEKTEDEHGMFLRKICESIQPAK